MLSFPRASVCLEPPYCPACQLYRINSQGIGHEDDFEGVDAARARLNLGDVSMNLPEPPREFTLGTARGHAGLAKFVGDRPYALGPRFA